jgi:GTPase SAR1 family protein
MFTTIAGFPVAKITGNPKYKSINLVLPDDKDLNLDIYDQPDICCPEANQLLKMLSDDNPLKEAINSLLDSCDDDFKLTKGQLEPMPNLRNERDVLYIFGPSGSGKSTYAGKYVKNYKQTFPDNDIILFSTVDTDMVLDKWKPIRVPITPDDLNHAKDLHFLDCLVVFDDIDTISNKFCLSLVREIRDKILETGRHQRVSVVCTSHLATNFAATRVMVNESQTVTFFPRSGGYKHIHGFLKDYAGMKKSEIDSIMQISSRWVTLHKNYPQYLVHEKGCKMIAKLDEESKRELKEKIYG